MTSSRRRQQVLTSLATAAAGVKAPMKKPSHKPAKNAVAKPRNEEAVKKAAKTASDKAMRAKPDGAELAHLAALIAVNDVLSLKLSAAERKLFEHMYDAHTKALEDLEIAEASVVLVGDKRMAGAGWEIDIQIPKAIDAARLARFTAFLAPKPNMANHWRMVPNKKTSTAKLDGFVLHYAGSERVSTAVEFVIKRGGLTMKNVEGARVVAGVLKAASAVVAAVEAAAAPISAAPFGVAKYAWYKYNGPNRFLKSKSGKSAALTKGTVFGVRPASSKKGVMRVIFADLGKNHVFSMSQTSVDTLISKSKTYKSSVKMAAAATLAASSATESENKVLEAMDEVLAIESSKGLAKARVELEKEFKARAAAQERAGVLLGRFLDECEEIEGDVAFNKAFKRLKGALFT